MPGTRPDPNWKPPESAPETEGEGAPIYDIEYEPAEPRSSRSGRHSPLQQYVPPQFDPADSMKWYNQLPISARTVLQLGAMGVVLFLFWLNDRSKTAQIAAWQEESTRQVRDAQSSVTTMMERADQRAAEDRRIAREDRMRGIEHGDRAVEVIGTKLDKVSAALEEQNRLLRPKVKGVTP